LDEEPERRAQFQIENLREGSAEKKRPRETEIIRRNPAAEVEMGDSVDESDEEDVVLGADDDGRQAKRARKTRKLSPLIFVERIDNEKLNAYCKLGCLSHDHKTRLIISVSSSDAPRRHASARHPTFLQMLNDCKNNEENSNKLFKDIVEANDKALERLKKINSKTLKFFKKIDSGLSNEVRSELTLMAWAVANNIPRVALNDSLFDAFLNSVGSHPVSNRHDLESVYLEAVDRFVLEDHKRRLSSCHSVATSQDGWKDQKRRKWIDSGVALVEHDLKKDVWTVDALDLDMIPLPGSSTGENVAALLKESLDYFLPEGCLIATNTRDGASDEVLASLTLVKEGNDHHCDAHNIQLSVHDALDPKKAHPPPNCEPHRLLIRKFHDIVVFINGHGDVLVAFRNLVAEKLKSGEASFAWEVLVLDNDTRWDTWLYLILRVLNFDREIISIQRMVELKFPQDLILTTEEVSLAFAMALILEPIKNFTKFVQNRNCVTLAYVPGMIDEILTQLSPDSFAAKLRDASANVRLQANALQKELSASIKTRFSGMFLGGSLALAARSFLPGPGMLSFANFIVNEVAKAEIVENILADVISLLPENTPADEIDDIKDTAESAIKLARKRLDKMDPKANPLVIWPVQKDLTVLHPAAKMLLGTPASSGDNERAFSSASFTMDNHRYMIDIETFRKEHRVRRFLVSGNDTHSQTGRQGRLDKLNSILERYDAVVNLRVPAENRQ